MFGRKNRKAVQPLGKQWQVQQSALPKSAPAWSNSEATWNISTRCFESDINELSLDMELGLFTRIKYSSADHPERSCSCTVNLADSNFFARLMFANLDNAINGVSPWEFLLLLDRLKFQKDYGNLSTRDKVKNGSDSFLQHAWFATKPQ